MMFPEHFFSVAGRTASDGVFGFAGGREVVGRLLEWGWVLGRVEWESGRSQAGVGQREV